MNNKSVLRYPGGKTRACKILLSIIEEYFNTKDIKKIYSPFFGGGSFEFCMNNTYNVDIIANDKFEPLIHFWNNVKHNKEQLCEDIHTYLNITKDVFYNLRENILHQNEYTQAVHYFVINRCSFSGATFSGGFSKESSLKRFTLSSIQRIRKLKLDKFRFTHLDFTEFIQCIQNSEDTLIFADPPYFLQEKSKLYGINGDLHDNFDHLALFLVLKSKNKWILTYNDCKFVRDLYSEYLIIDTLWTYAMNKSKKSSEIIIINN